MTRPYLEDKTIIYDVTPYNTITTQVAQDNLIPMIDIQKHFATMSSYFVDPVNDTTHLNAQGLKEMASYIKSEMQRLGVL
jgi:hydrogenase maturation factor HypF (carbamoyltransferase family)